MRKLTDLALLNLAAVLLVGVVLGLPDNPLRIPLGLAVVLFCPGYALIGALYPGRTDIEGIERLALSFGVSLAVVPLVGLILNFSPWGIRPGPVLFSLAGITTIFSLLAARARLRLPTAERFSIKLIPKISHLARLSWAQLSVAAAVVLFGTAVGWRLYAADSYPGEAFTEFYILGRSGKTTDYPAEVPVGQAAEVFVVIVNHELKREAYSITIREGDRALATIGPITLSDGHRWETRTRFSPMTRAARDHIQFLLYKNDESRPYRLLHIWMKVG